MSPLKKIKCITYPEKEKKILFNFTGIYTLEKSNN